MEKGQVKMEELVKVIDHMKTLSREDLIKKMLDSPAKKMEKMRTAWQRLLTEINSSFMIDAFTTFFDTMAEGLKDMTKWMKDNKETIDSWVKGIKITGKVLMELAPILLSIWGLRKVFGLFGMFTAGSRTMRNLRYLLLGGDIMRLLGGGGRGLGARIGAGLVRALKTARFIMIAAMPLLIAGIADDIYTAMTGGNSLIGTAAQSDNPIAKWLARSILGAFEIGKAAFVNFFALFDLLFVSRDWGKFTGVIKENALELRNWMMKNFGELIPDSLIHAAQYISMLFSSVMGNFKTLMQSQEMLTKGNVVGAFSNLGNLTTPDKIPSFAEYRNSLIAKPINLPVSAPTPTPAQYRPDPLGLNAMRTPPPVNIEINATGVTAEELNKIVSDTYIQNTRAMVIGASANWQGGNR